jgi:translation elongation factor P/translation initiation factor 5A
MMLEYYEYKKKQWIDEACEFIKENTALEYEFYRNFRKAMEVKNV